MSIAVLPGVLPRPAGSRSPAASRRATSASASCCRRWSRPGAAAPVFAKVAEAARCRRRRPRGELRRALLELAPSPAVLYTQGETGIAGPLEPVESSSLGGSTLQIPPASRSRFEALSGKGGGRFAPIKEAVEKGHFRDLRLIRPALAAIDDGYADVAELIAEKVLPHYGTAVLEELRATADPKGKGHPRRLKLMHRIDAAGHARAGEAGRWTRVRRT